LAILFKVEIRLKIVTELYLREMSPKDFQREFGGGTVSRVAQHFELLETHGWLRRVGPKDRDTRRRGRTETLYRATELAFFDAETWALLPYSVRLAFSWSSFQAIAGHLREGIEAAEFEGRPSRNLTCTRLQMDDLGWTRIIKALNALFESLYEEQDDAKIRIAHARADLIRANVFLFGFESPRSDERLAVRLADGSTEPPIPVLERLAPIFADDLCMQILAELNRRDMSIKQFHREFAVEISEAAVRHRFERLNKLAWLAIVDKIPRRGAEEYVYRATRPAVVNNGPWADASDKLMQAESWATFSCLSDLVKEAIITGNFDFRDDRHLSWTIISLDREGWARLLDEIEALQAFVIAEQDQAIKRIGSGARPIAMTASLFAVEAPIQPGRAF
jgi:hypothetical protein